MVFGRFFNSFSMITCLLLLCVSVQSGDLRQVIRLDGLWEIEEGSMDTIPEAFPHRVVVPGLIDMSSPDFFEVGIPSARREAFWYRKTFKTTSDIPETAILKIHKAKYGTKVYLNGKLLGEHLPCFTPAYFNVKDALNGDGQENELIVRVGAYKDSVPSTIPSGADFEKYKYIPGIYDSVDLILSGKPYIRNVQLVPNLETSSVGVIAEIDVESDVKTLPVSVTIHEAGTGRNVGEKKTYQAEASQESEGAFELRVPIPNAHLWSPEDPFLYRITIETQKDCYETRFGMRTFSFDADSGRAILNGKPYFMRGTNVCIYRFFEDASRDDLPWQTDWVRRLHQQFKAMHWNSIRYCIGFPPEIWYDIADELGFLIQDEFPIWHGGQKENWPEGLANDEIAKEYKDWMRERWNHPCVVIWDAQNETVTEETGKAIGLVRELDRSNRPWENGWSPPQRPDDPMETHPYLMNRLPESDPPPEGLLSTLLKEPRVPHNGPSERSGEDTVYQNPNVINEYGWMWLNRNGTSTSLTHKFYNKYLGPDASVDARRELYGRYLAAMTEFWRCHRKCAGVLHFCGLGYSRPGGIDRPEAGATSDNFINVRALEYDPYFEKFVKDSFAPVGLMLDFWDARVALDSNRQLAVYVINDLYDDWEGLVRVRIMQEGRPVCEYSQVCKVESLGREILPFSVHFPKERGSYEIIAELISGQDAPVQSHRVFEVVEEL